MSNVSRSVYQKLKEENKRLIEDIRILVKPGLEDAKKLKIIKIWQLHFKNLAITLW